MTFSQYAGTAIVPTLARIVLAAVFIVAGWNKVFEQSEFTAEQATKLRSLGVTAEPAQPKTTAAAGDGGYEFRLASHRQEVPADVAQPGSLRDPQGDLPQGEQPQPPESPATAPAAGTTPAAGSSTQPTIIDPQPQAPLPAGTYTAQALHGLTLMLHDNNFPQPVWMARLAAFTELVGGAMLLIGLFSRIWGLGLAITMGVAFYLVSMKMNHIFQTDPRVFALDPMKGMVAYIQLSLFVLAFGVFLTGAGPLSLDRILFGGPGEADAGDVKID